MRHESVRRFRPGTARRHDGGLSTAELPPEFAFLPPHVIASEILVATVHEAQRLGVEPTRLLIATGRLAASIYYTELARYLGVEFVDGWPPIKSPCDVAAAHRLGHVELIATSSARWLIAPEGRTLRALVSAHAPDHETPHLAITTPAHLASIIHFEAQQTIERIATETLPREKPSLSAKGAVDKKGVFAAVAISLGAWIVAPRPVGIVLGFLFLAAITFRACLYAAGLETPRHPPRRLEDDALPFYTVLVPLHREAAIVPDLLEALDALDYPRAKLEVLILIEPEDDPTRAALAKEDLPPWIHVVFGPVGGRLRTKPRALNIGLLLARGEILTIFDAEDRPQSCQLRDAAASFAAAPSSLACLQAQLSIDNGGRSLLARMFAIEYAALFDVLNVGISNLSLPMALGGTSSHFKTSVLREAGGWDAWNVTEDADLGLRLARLGYDVAFLQSTTFEAAPETIDTWFKQRRRWTKGWMQTMVVLLKDGPRLAVQLGYRRTTALCLLLVNLVVGPLLFPPFSAYAIYRFARYGIANPVGLIQISEATLEVAVITLGIVSTIVGGYLGIRARGLRGFLSSLPLLVLYQLLISGAAWMGLWDLFWRPHHWHKTEHAAHDGGASDTNSLA